MSFTYVKAYDESYLNDVDRIWKRFYADKFSLPNLNNTVTTLVAVKDNKLIAFGMIKLYAEAIMVMDGDASLRDKTVANELLLARGFEDARDFGLEELIVSVSDEKYIELLKNKYDFKLPSQPILVKKL